MARFGQGLIQGLTNPQFQQGLFELGDRIAERRRDERELQAIQGAATLGNQGVSFAQAGNVQELQSTITQLTEQLGQAKNVNTAAQIQSQINKLQGLIPQTQELSTRNSVNTIMGIDGRLANKEALKAAIRASDPALTEQQVESRFKTQVQKLEQQKSELLASDTLINEQYRSRTLALSQAMAAQEELEAQNWIGQNRNAIVAAVKSGNPEAMQASIANAPAAIADEAQDYLDSQIQSYNATLDLQERSIAKTQAPETKSFKDQISEVPEEYDTRTLNTLNANYEEFVKKHWNGKTWTSEGAKADARALEQRVLQELGRVQSAISDTRFAEGVKKAAADRAEVRDITQDIRLYSPSPDEIEKEAELLAAADPQFEDEKYENIALEDRIALEKEAEERLIQEYREARIDVIADIDPNAEIIKEFEKPITGEDTSVLGLYSEEDQKIILQNYEDSYGVVSLQDMIERLEIDEEISPTTAERKDDVLFEYSIRDLPYDARLRAKEERRKEKLGFFGRLTDKPGLLFRN